jgi:hypothetical protein
VSDARVDVAGFARDGFTLVRSVFQPDEVERLRATVIAIRERQARANLLIRVEGFPENVILLGDLPGMPEFRRLDYVVFDPRIVSCAKQILGSEVVYYGDATAQSGEGQRGFHKDNVDRADPGGLDWLGDYTVIRFGIYLQDHERHSGGLTVRKGSHRIVSRHLGRAVNVPNRAGDVVIWNMRASHSGNAVRLRGLPGLTLPPRVETMIPRTLRMPAQRERISIFLSLGKPGNHLDRINGYQLGREDYLNQYRHCVISQEIESLAEARGVTLRRPSSDYGSRYPEIAVSSATAGEHSSSRA